MSYEYSFEDQFTLLSDEDRFSSHRPPQFNETNLPPTLPSGPSAVPPNVSGDDAPAEMSSGHPSTCTGSTDSTEVENTTATATATAATATNPRVRNHVHFHVNRDYNVAIPQPLTEWAMAAHDDEFRMASCGGDFDGWRRNGSQLDDMLSITLSRLRSPRTGTMTNTGSLGSSWSLITIPASSVPGDGMAECISAAGLQFEDVPAGPTVTALLDEDCL